MEQLAAVFLNITIRMNRFNKYFELIVLLGAIIFTVVIVYFIHEFVFNFLFLDTFFECNSQIICWIRIRCLLLMF